ncbi:lithostathine-1-alpha-like [Trachypithecus francoisi]|uniref:lithostathine-1-alpha-like n=1 Tax=Trachypithecus francoisi TaxID=54180 RepID=UPI00141A7E83|nr:lithostathine-1-alpha-like [Trachypithecus francoisi]XP_033031149.1 lithostathine-1-alpha-like [Trachypithecus francoisi]
MAQPNSCFILISCLMFLSLSQGQEVQTDSPKARISCPEGTNAYGSYCYYFNEDLETWVDADLYCQNMNSGNLVSVLTEAEGAFVASLIKETSTDDGNVWIGLYDPKKNHRWHWSSGSLVSYKSWVIGSPSSINPGYCVSLTSSSGFKGWKDVSCEEKFSFVCKFKN